MQEFVGLRPKYYAFLCTGKVDKNVLHHSKPVEKKTAKGVKRKVKDDHLHFVHYLNTLHSFQSYVCKQNLILSSAHTIRTTHTRKIGLTAFDTKRWLCEDTVHTHSHGHKDTVSDSEYMELVNKCWIVECVTNAGVFNRSDLPGTTALRPEQLGLRLNLILVLIVLLGMGSRNGTTPEQSESESDWDSHKTVIHILICNLFI